MNKMKVTVLGLAVMALVALFPSSSLSGAEKEETITLSEDNLIVLNSEVNGESVGQVIAKAKELAAKQTGGLKNKLKNKVGIANQCHLRLFLNTPGGNIQSGLEMQEALNGIGCSVDTITLFAASMGFQIAQNLGERLILKNGVLMSHRAKGGFEGEFGGQVPSQIESRYALWKSRLDELDAQTVARTKGKQTMASYQKQYASEMWLTGQQSVDQGYADRVVKVKCDSTLTGTSSHEAQIMIFQVTYDLDNCPLNTSPMNVRVGFITNKGTTMNSEDFLKSGGQFGASCLTESVNNKDKLCALDTSLNMEKIKELKKTFVNQFENKKTSIVPMY